MSIPKLKRNKPQKRNEPTLVSVREEDKEEYLNKNYPFGDIPGMDERKRCLHCDKSIRVGDFKVVFDPMMNAELIYCPNWPDCDGTVLDWMPEV